MRECSYFIKYYSKTLFELLIIIEFFKKCFSFYWEWGAKLSSLETVRWCWLP